jgi:type II secretory pathway pseudopilin PulG
VELLTVIAIIAVLATLVSASLANAQRKGRKAVSTSNLRQIALAFNLYLDDRDKRPEAFRQLVDNKYLNERVLICPEDRIVKNWAGELEKLDAGRKSSVVVALPGRENPGAQLENLEELPHSYFKAFDYHDEIWDQIDKSPRGGLAACQLHGIGRQRKDEPPSMAAYQGLVLRAVKDGSVVPLQVFWDGFGTANFGNAQNNTDGAATGAPTGAPNVPIPGGTSQLPLFLDPAQ